MGRRRPIPTPTSHCEMMAYSRLAKLMSRHVLSHLAGEAFPDVETVAVGEVSSKGAVRLGTPEVHVTEQFDRLPDG
jgi:hypothetical protein